MRAITLFLFFVAGQFSFAGGGTNIIALSDWSQPVGTDYGQILRGRMLLAQEHSPAYLGQIPETEFYLELQNVSRAVGRPMQIYFEPGAGLHCEVLNANGKPPPAVAGGGSGSGAGPCWITLPYDATIRLRANMYGFGKKKGDGFLIAMSEPRMQRWDIQTGDTSVYFMSGKFTVKTPTNHVTKNFDEASSIWTGTLDLPKMKIPPQKP
jgi:hypothetical protein